MASIIQRKEGFSYESTDEKTGGGRKNTLNSLEELTAAAKELGYTEQEIQKALEGFDGLPLDEDAMEGIADGYSISYGSLRLC